MLAVTATAENLRDAVHSAYEGTYAIHFDGMQYRFDIAARALPVKDIPTVKIVFWDRLVDRLAGASRCQSSGRMRGMEIVTVVSTRRRPSFLSALDRMVVESMWPTFRAKGYPKGNL